MQVYDEMVDSGISWIGNIPKVWGVRSFSRLLSVQKGKKVDTVEDGLPILDMSYLREGGEPGSYGPHDTDSCYVAKFGDLLVLWDGSKAGEFIKARNGIVGSTLAKIGAGEKVDERYLFYVAKFQEKYLQDMTNGMGIPHVDRRVLMSLKTFTIPIDLQQKIADFLDKETAKIDNLIAKQERLLELLEEKRRATITHAVTRGLDPHVELKETNIPWLGKIPNKWSVTRVYQYVKTGSGTTPNSNLGEWYTDSEDGIPWVTTGELREGVITQTKVKVTAEAVEKHSALKVYPKDTLLIAMYGATIGRLGTLGVEATTNQACCALMPNGKLLTEYLYFYLLGMRDQLLLMSSGGGQPNISKEKIDTFSLVVPSVTEQQNIVAHLIGYEQKTAELKDRIQTQISLLRECRTSLISHAVTGKIKT